MTYDISLDKKKAILLVVGCILLVVLSFFAGLFLGAMMQQPETVTAAPNSEKPKKAFAGAPAVLAKKLPAKPKVRLPVKPKVKLPAKPRVKLPVIAKKPAPTTPVATKVTSAAAPAPALPAPPTIKPEPYPYSIRLASYKNQETALKALVRHQNAGLSPYFAKVNLGEKGVWWRLFTGYYPSRKAAQAAVTKHNLKGVQVIKTAYANLAGIFSSKNELNDIFKRLDSQGYSPYIIKDAENHLRLFTGAFITKKGVRDQNQDLKADGIDSKVVER